MTTFLGCPAQALGLILAFLDNGLAFLDLVVPSFADFALVDVHPGEDEQVPAVYARHADPEREPLLRRLRELRRNATAATSQEDDHLVQELYIVPSHEPGTVHGAAAHQHSFNVNIALPETIAGEVEHAQGQMSVTIVPVGAGPEGVLNTAPKTVHVKLSQPYFTAED